MAFRALVKIAAKAGSLSFAMRAATSCGSTSPWRSLTSSAEASCWGSCIGCPIGRFS